MHLGQVGQPSPEPVSRTSPPVTTMTMFMINETTAQRRRAYGPRTIRSGDGPLLVRCFGLGARLLYDVQRKPFHAASPAATSQANKTSTDQPRICPLAAARSPSPSAAVGSAPITGRSTAG